MARLILLTLLLLSQLSSNDDLKSYKSVKSLEMTLENQIRNELALYTSSPFNVSVTVVLESIQTTKSVKKQKSLPGVYQQVPASSSSQDLKSELDHIEVYVTLDTSVDPAIVSLAKKIAYEKANLSDRRGDRVIVKKKALQLKKKKLEVSDDILSKLQQLDEQIADLGDMNKRERENIETNFQNRLDQTKNESLLAAQKNTDSTDSLKTNVMYWMLSIIGVFIIFSYLVFLYLSNVFKKQREYTNGLEVKLHQDIDGVKTHLQDSIDSLETGKSVDVDQRLINDLSTLVIARKQAVTTFIKSELNTKEGQEKIALLVHILGANTISALLYKNEKMLEEVLTLSSTFHFEPERQASMSDTLYKELLEKTNDQYKNNKDFDEFAFVKNMGIDQILLLMEGEDIGVKAFILTQIDKAMSAQLLQQVEENTKLTLLVELSKMRPMNAQTYSALSKKLSLKIATFPKINHFVVDGEREMAVQILHLSPKDQSALLAKILTQDANLYKRIKENFTFAEDIDRLPDEDIKKLLLTLDDNDIALSLYQLPVETKDKLLSKVNERKMVMLDEKIKHYLENTPSQEKMSYAIYNFLNEINLQYRK